MTQTAKTEFDNMLAAAGPMEKARAERLIARVEVIPNNPSARAMVLTETEKVGAADEVVFGTGDQIGANTFTSDAKFVRGETAQGVNFDVLVHEPVPLRGL